MGRDLKINDGVDLHGHVVLGDDRLGIEVRHLLLQADLFHHALDERQLKCIPAPNAVERAQALDDIGLGLLDDLDAADDDGQNENDQNDDGDGSRCRHSSSSLFSCLFHSRSMLMDEVNDAGDHAQQYGGQSAQNIRHIKAPSVR